MEPVEGAKSFQASGDAYDRFMGRYSRSLAPVFADWVGVGDLRSTLDVGCGPGAFTAVLVDRLGASAVTAIDPSPPFVEACSHRFPDVDVRLGRAEAIPFGDDSFDGAFAQLVLHFLSDPEAGAGELRRVVRPGGVVAACVWDFAEGMQMLRHFWDSALAFNPTAEDEARTMRFGREGEVSDLFRFAGLDDVEESTLRVSSTYESFDELWSGFMAGIGPAGAYLVALDDEARQSLRDDLFARVGAPAGPFTLHALARCAKARVPA